jgi:uncharacterized protein (TIGR00369 family)
MQNEEAVRQRIVTWDDPMVGARQALHLSGLEFLQAIRDGHIASPPISQLLGMTIDEVEAGRVVFGLVPGEHHYNPIGTVHGGIAATLCDSVMACAVQSVLPLGMIYTTLEIHVNYVRPMTAATGPVRCIGEVIHQGRRMATAQARLIDSQGKLYSHGTTTCMIFPAKPE